MERVWNGRVRPGAEAEHQAFLVWLGSAEGRGLLARSLLDSYQLLEQDGRLTVRMGAPDPPAIVKFLRHRRFWPESWQFESADSEAVLGAGAVQRVSWQR